MVKRTVLSLICGAHFLQVAAYHSFQLKPAAGAASPSPAHALAELHASSSPYDVLIPLGFMAATTLFFSVLAADCSKHYYSNQQRTYVSLNEKYSHLAKLAEQQNSTALEQYILEKYVGYEDVFKAFAEELQSDYAWIASNLEDKEADYFKEQQNGMSAEYRHSHLATLKQHQDILAHIKTVWAFFHKTFYHKYHASVILGPESKLNTLVV